MEVAIRQTPIAVLFDRRIKSAHQTLADLHRGGTYSDSSDNSSKLRKAIVLALQTPEVFQYCSSIPRLHRTMVNMLRGLLIRPETLADPSLRDMTCATLEMYEPSVSAPAPISDPALAPAPVPAP